MEKLMEASGVGQTVTVFPNKVAISGKKGLMGMLAAGGSSQEIRIKEITGIEFKKAGSMVNGYIQFRTAASANSKQGGMFAVLEVADDPNTIHFLKKHNDVFMEVKDKIEEIMDQMEQNQGVSVQAPSSADELVKFSGLLKDGLITQDEFDKKKKELLGLQLKAYLYPIFKIGVKIYKI